MGWAWPWMLLWLPAVILPLLVFRRSIARARTVSWGPIDLVAIAARRRGVSRRGYSLPLVLLRSLMLLLAIVAAARPFLGGPEAASSTAERIVAGSARGTAARRIMFVEPDMPPGADATEIRHPLRLAITALCTTGGLSVPNPRLPAILPAVDAVQARDLATTIGDGSRPGDAGRGTLVVLSDGALPADFAATDGAAARLERAVDRGAAVLVLLGPRAMEPPDRERLSAWLDKVCGVSIEGRLDGIGRRIEVEPPLAGLAADEPTAPPFVPLVGPSIGSFAGLFQGAATVLARTVPDGRPLVVEARVGRGRVCVAALPLTLPDQDGWSDLAAWPAFVPFVDRLATRLLDADEADDLPAARLEHVGRFPPWPLPASIARLLLLAAIAIALVDPVLSWALARRATPAHGEPKNLSLWPARLAILGALLAMLAADRPAASPETRRERGRRVAFLIDVSPSMATPDAARMSRLQAFLAALSPAVGPTPIDAIRAQGRDVSFTAVGRDRVPLDAADPQTLARLEPLPPSPRASRLGDAVEATLATGDDSPAAVVVASDGEINAGASWAHAARAAAAHGVPIIAIPVGGSGAADAVSESDAFAAIVIEATLPRIVWRDEPVVITVAADRPADTPDRVPVVLADRDGRTLAEGSLRPEADGAARLVGRIEWTPRRSGRQTLVVRAGRAGGVAPDATAAIPATVISTEVIEEPVRVLIVDAVPRFESRFLEHLLAGDRRFAVESSMLDVLARLAARPAEGKEPARFASPLPDTAAGWGRFDAVVLGDVAGGDLADNTTEGLLEAARTEGLGIAWLPGRRWRDRPLENSRLAALLPAAPRVAAAASDDAPRRLRNLPAGSRSGWLPESVAAATDARPVELFDTVRAVQLDPTARLLAVSTPADAADGARAEPAIVLDQYGPAPVLGHFFETWRLRGPHGGYEAYWRNALARLAERRVLARLAVATLELHPRHLAAGDAARIDVVPTAGGADLSGWRLEHRGPDGATQRLDLPPLQVRLERLAPGWHTLALVPPPDGDRPARSSVPRGEVSCEFLVTPPVEERPGGPARTADMVAAAVASGGAVVPLDAIGSLADTLADRIARGGAAEAAAGRPRVEPLLGSALASNLLMLALLASCGLEWSLRAGRGMP